MNLSKDVAKALFTRTRAVHESLARGVPTTDLRRVRAGLAACVRATIEATEPESMPVQVSDTRRRLTGLERSGAAVPPSSVSEGAFFRWPFIRGGAAIHRITLSPP